MASVCRIARGRDRQPNATRGAQCIQSNVTTATRTVRLLFSKAVSAYKLSKSEHRNMHSILYHVRAKIEGIGVKLPTALMRIDDNNMYKIVSYDDA